VFSHELWQHCKSCLVAEGDGRIITNSKVVIFYDCAFCAFYYWNKIHDFKMLTLFCSLIKEPTIGYVNFMRMKVA